MTLAVLALLPFLALQVPLPSPTSTSRPIIALDCHVSTHVIPVTMPDGSVEDEPLMIQVPGLLPIGGKLPLVVAFHGFSRTELSIFGPQSDLPDEACQRKWFLLAPRARNQVDHGTRFGKAHVDGAIQWALDNYPINPNRIYGIGHSMGGSFALSYAAHRQDPAGPRFAAVVSNAGLPSQRAAYATTGDTEPVCDMSGVNMTRQMWFHCAIGDQLAVNDCATDKSFTCNEFFPDDPMMPFGTVPWLYQASSAIDMEKVGGAWQETPGTIAMAHNLRHVPQQAWWDVNDDLNMNELIPMSQFYVSWMQGIGGSITSVEVDDPDGDGFVHEWGTIDADAVFGFFAGKTASFPASSSPGNTITHTTVAPEPGTYHYFGIEQHGPAPFPETPWTSGFSSFNWSVFPAIASNPVMPLQDNTLSVSNAVNVQRLRFDWTAAGLDAGQNTVPGGGQGGLLVLMSQSDPGSPYLEEIVLTDYPGDPNVSGEIGAPGWVDVTYDAGMQELTLRRNAPNFSSIRVLYQR
ncbi:MAG: hypothetical protein AAF533_03250 [Acidobacteriota bacterium]